MVSFHLWVSNLVFFLAIVQAVADDNSSPYKACSEIFIGGGWAGVYSFYRRVMEDPDTRASKACLFEQSWRIGGRTYSVAVNHSTPYIQDVGAYRFSPDMHLPGDLIMKDLEIPTECYQETCPSAKEDFPEPFLFNYSAPLRRVVNPETRLPAGYATPLHKMIDLVEEKGGRVFAETSLVALNVKDDDSVILTFKNANSGVVSSIDNPELVILNLPRNKLFDVEGVEESLSDPVTKTLKCVVFDRPPDLFGALDFSGDTSLLKAYMYFEDAFWHTKLNETVGAWPVSNDFTAHPTKEGVRFNIRWHDGPVECSSDGELCDGLLETYYSVSDETFYSSLSVSPDEPLGQVWDSDGPDAINKLETAHAALIDILNPLLQEKDIDSSEIAPPKGLFVGSWRRPSEEFPLGQGYTAPTKVYYAPEVSGGPDRACGVSGLTEESYRETALRPWGENLPIFLVNNDWVCQNVWYLFGDWAEESLLQAERAMVLLGSPKPEWLDEDYYQEKVLSKVDGVSPFFLVGSYSSRNSAKIGALLILSCVLIGLAWKRFRNYQKRDGKDYEVIP